MPRLPAGFPLNIYWSIPTTPLRARMSSDMNTRILDRCPGPTPYASATRKRDLVPVVALRTKCMEWPVPEKLRSDRRDHSPRPVDRRSRAEHWEAAEAAHDHTYANGIVFSCPTDRGRITSIGEAKQGPPCGSGELNQKSSQIPPLPTAILAGCGESSFTDQSSP